MASLTFDQSDGQKSTIKISYVLAVLDGVFWTGKDTQNNWWLGFLDDDNRVFSVCLNPVYADTVVRQIQDWIRAHTHQPIAQLFDYLQIEWFYSLQ